MGSGIGIEVLVDMDTEEAYLSLVRSWKYDTGTLKQGLEAVETMEAFGKWENMGQDLNDK